MEGEHADTIHSKAVSARNSVKNFNKVGKLERFQDC